MKQVSRRWNCPFCDTTVVAGGHPLWVQAGTTNDAARHIARNHADEAYWEVDDCD